MLRIACLLGLALLSTTLDAQARWTQLSPANAPSRRSNSHLTADLVTAYVFGGNLSSTVYYNDLWQFTGTDWVQLTADGAAGSPPKRRWGSMTFDFARNEVVVFGGQGPGATTLGDTWTFNGTAWTQHSPAVAPSARRWAKMGYDWVNNQVILFGGYDGSSPNDETWAWNGTLWTKLTPANAPSARSRQSMGANRNTAELFLFGGTTGTSSPALGDLWKWDGSNWIAVSATNIPYTTGLLTAPMYWDELRSRLVVFGGYNGFERNGTFEFDGSAWNQRTFTNAPSARSRPGMAYLGAFNKAIMFGGYGGPVAQQLGDTWEYQTDAPASVSTTGTGCAGSGGVPTLTITGLPWIDDTFALAVGNIGAGNSMLIIGLSKTVWSGNPLPFDLSVIGFPGCDLLVSMDLMVGGATNLNLPVPNDPTLVGIEVFLQAASLGPANTLGASARTELKIGAR